MAAWEIPTAQGIVEESGVQRVPCPSCPRCGWLVMQVGLRNGKRYLGEGTIWGCPRCRYWESVDFRDARISIDTGGECSTGGRHDWVLAVRVNGTVQVCPAVFTHWCRECGRALTVND